MVSLATILKFQKNDCFYFQLRAAEDEDKGEEKKENIEETEEDSEQEESDEHNATLWSRLSEVAIENEKKAVGDSQEEELETVEDTRRVDNKTNNSVESQSSTLKSTEGTCSAKDCDSFVPDTRNDSCTSQSEQLNQETVTEKEVSLLTTNHSTCSHEAASEQYRQVKPSDADRDLATDDVSAADKFSGKLLTRDELLALFKILHMRKGHNTADDSQKVLTTVGLVSNILMNMEITNAEN